MSNRATSHARDDRRLAELFDELAHLVRSGQPDRVEAFLAAQPADADELRRLLPVLSLLVNSRAPSSSDALSSELSESIIAEEVTIPSTPTDGVLGDFRILREIGRGGMGIVYEARQISLKRRVALKVLPFAAVLDSQQLRRFHNEAQAAAGLHHTNIVPVYSVGCERGINYYAMQYIDGITLAQLVAKVRESGNPPRDGIVDAPISLYEPQTASGVTAILPDSHSENGDAATFDGRLRLAAKCSSVPTAPETGPLAALCTAHARDSRAYFRRIAELGIQAAEALDYAHQQGIVHRDIKPANLLLDCSGKLWITDFGLARIGTDSNLTMTGDLLGTLRYMSPEQMLSQRPLLDHRTDIYSLGITLYELLVLEPAFPAIDRQELLRQIPLGNPRTPRSVRPQIPSDLETIVLRTIECEPAERYQTAGELADDLRRYLKDEPIRAKRPTFVQRAAKWSRRHRSVVASMIVVMMLSIVGLAIAATMIARQRNAAESAAVSERQGARREQAAADLARSQRHLAEQQRDEARYNLYVSDMHLAHQDWKSGHVERMRKLLGAHVPQPGETDVRGWEWRYLMSLSRQHLAAIDAESGSITSLAWSPDGRLLATGGEVVKIWDTSNQRLVTAITGATTTIPNVVTIASNIAWSPDGTRLATAAPGKMMKIWDPRDGTELLAFGPFRTQPGRICWSSDGRFLAACDGNGAFLIREATADSKPVSLEGKVPSIWSLAWSPDGKSLAVGSDYNGLLDIWDAGQHTLRHSFKAHGHAIMSLGWSPNGRYLATGSVDQHLKVWDALTWKTTVDRRAHSGAIRSVTWSPDGQWLVTGSDDSTVKVWDASTGSQVNVLRGHVDRVQAAVWSPTGDRLVSAGTAGTAKFWTPFQLQEAEHLSGGWPVAWSPNGERLVGTGYRGGSVRVFDSSTGKIEREVTFEGLRFFSGFDWSPTGRVIAAGNFGGELLLFDAASGRELWRNTGCHASKRADRLAEVRSAAWNCDGSRLASAGVDNTIKIWEPATGKLLKTLRGHTSHLGSAIWSPDGKRLASKDWAQNVKVWNASTWREELDLRCHPFATFSADGRYSIAWSPDGSELAAGTSEGWIVIWNSTTGRERIAMRGHPVNIRSISWNPDGTRLATGSEDHQIRIWDVATGREMLTLEGHATSVQSVSWSPDGRRLVSGSTINTVPLNEEPAICIWDAARGYDERP